jgi:hypothetical protein
LNLSSDFLASTFVFAFNLYRYNVALLAASLRENNSLVAIETLDLAGRVVTPGGCQMGCMDHTDCHQFECVLTCKKTWWKVPTLLAGNLITSEGAEAIGGRVALHSLPGVRLVLHGPCWLSSIEPCFDFKITWWKVPTLIGGMLRENATLVTLDLSNNDIYTATNLGMTTLVGLYKLNSVYP